MSVFCCSFETKKCHQEWDNASIVMRTESLVDDIKFLSSILGYIRTSVLGDDTVSFLHNLTDPFS